MIDDVISKSKDVAIKHFGSFDDFASLETDAVSTQEAFSASSEKITVDLGDGKTARVTLPEEFALESTSS